MTIYKKGTRKYKIANKITKYAKKRKGWSKSLRRYDTISRTYTYSRNFVGDLIHLYRK